MVTGAKVREMQGREWLRTSQPPPPYAKAGRDTVTRVTRAEISGLSARRAMKKGPGGEDAGAR